MMGTMRLRQLSHSIILRILLLGLGIVVVGTTARYFILSQFLREDLDKVVASQQQALASYVARDVDSKLVERRDLLQRLAASLPRQLLGQPRQLRAWLQERHELHPLFNQGLLLVDSRGAILADFPERPLQARINLADREYVQAALAGEASLGRPAPDWLDREPVLPMAAPVRDEQGRVQAALVGLTPLATPGFLNLLLQSRIGRSGGFLLISPRDRVFVAATEPELVLKPTPPAGVNPLHDRAMAGYRGTGITVNAKGVEEAVAIVSVPSAEWFVVARLPTAEAFEPVTRVQQYILRNSVVVSLVFLVLASLGLAHVFRPLRRTAEHADRMTRGECPLEPLPVLRNDEVGHLTAAFNRLLRKLSESQAALAQAAHHDALTGLPNRMLLADRLSQARVLAQRKGSRIALLFLDLDGFKPINDSLGHEAGDEVLRLVAGRLSGCVRASDTLARVGGDEFVILMGDLDSQAEQAAARVAAKCIEALAEPFPVQDQSCRLGVSIGIALGDGESAANTLLLQADQAMYRAKESGRGRYVIAAT
ncbi:MAG: diguanylate cyclase [Betaproteobacteria bacterium]|nr:MAG: diguanylate cyclase [Betaproteobacteria bacterium]